uniref:Uncharacterized protein n=1 Tax=Acrobeloides nanus TaxID=290746 RepID=A0A914CGX3_9BILA
MAAIGLDTLLQTLGEVIHRTVDNILRYVVPGSRHQPTTRQRRVATEFARSERHRLQHMEHPGGRGMIKAPLVNRRIEKEFDEGLEQHISRCYRPCGG